MKFWKRFFGQKRQRSGGNFYIDIKKITAAAKTVNPHNLLRKTYFLLEIVELVFQSPWI